jgi:hypothetical protein
MFHPVLEVKMGAKNMTLSRRVSGTRFGECLTAQ